MNQKNEVITTLIFATFVIIIVLIIISVLLLVFYSKHRYSFQKNLDSLTADYEKALLNTQLEIQEQTLKNIAQEIHDHIGLSLTLAKLHLNTLAPSENVYNREKIEDAIILITDSIQDLSNMSHTLSADTVKKNGLLRAIEEETERIRRIGILDLRVKVSEHSEYLQDDIELVIFRIIQECLNNTIKHADAKTACIELDYQESHLVVTVKDNGKGFEEKASKNRSGSGLLNIESRTKMINGNCEIISSENGTEIKITIPFKSTP